MGPSKLEYVLDDPLAVETFEKITIPHKGGVYSLAVWPSTSAKEQSPYEIESREENGLQIFKLIDKNSIKYVEKILKQYYEHIERTQHQPDYIYLSVDTLKRIASEVKPYDFVPGPRHSLSDSTLYGMKIRLSESVPGGEVYLIREEPWI